MVYYFFDDYGELVTEKYFSNEDEASVYCEVIGAEYFCGSNYYDETE